MEFAKNVSPLRWKLISTQYFCKTYEIHFTSHTILACIELDFRTLISLFQVKLNERIIATSQGLLIRSVQDSDQGLYHCIATENSFKQTIAKINFKVLDSEMVAVVTDKWSPWTWASSVRALPFHPKDIMGAFSHSEMQMINQYCKDTRQQHQQGEESQKMRGDYGKLKALINSRKSRNRRNQLPES